MRSGLARWRRRVSGWIEDASSLQYALLHGLVVCLALAGANAAVGDDPVWWNLALGAIGGGTYATLQYAWDPR